MWFSASSARSEVHLNRSFTNPRQSWLEGDAEDAKRALRERLVGKRRRRGTLVALNTVITEVSDRSIDRVVVVGQGTGLSEGVRHTEGRRCSAHRRGLGPEYRVQQADGRRVAVRHVVGIT